MKKPSKGLKITVLVASFGLLAAYVLYASGVITLPKLGPSPSMPGNLSHAARDTPPFKLPFYVSKTFYDSLEVVGFKALPDDPQHVLVLAIPFSPVTVVPGMGSSKSTQIWLDVSHKSAGADSMMVEANWEYMPDRHVHLPRQHEERMWMFSSKAAPLDEPELSEGEKREQAAFKNLSTQPWQMVTRVQQAFRLPEPFRPANKPIQKDQPVNPNR